MGEVYSLYRDTDGFLYITYASQEMFGAPSTVAGPPCWAKRADIMNWTSDTWWWHRAAKLGKEGTSWVRPRILLPRSCSPTLHMILPHGPFFTPHMSCSTSSDRWTSCLLNLVHNLEGASDPECCCHSLLLKNVMYEKVVPKYEKSKNDDIVWLLYVGNDCNDNNVSLPTTSPQCRVNMMLVIKHLYLLLSATDCFLKSCLPFKNVKLWLWKHSLKTCTVYPAVGTTRNKAVSF